MLNITTVENMLAGGLIGIVFSRYTQIYDRAEWRLQVDVAWQSGGYNVVAETNAIMV